MNAQGPVRKGGQEAPETPRDRWIRQFKSSPAYTAAFDNTLKTAVCSYKVARCLSVVMFAIGVSLFVAALGFAWCGEEMILSLVFGGLGTVNVGVLLLYRPIERIQRGVDELIRCQIACLSFITQYDSISQDLSELSLMEFEKREVERQLRLLERLSQGTSQLIDDLEGDIALSPSTSVDGNSAPSDSQ